MQTTVKVAVSLPKGEFRLVEKQRRLLKVSRSAAFRQALRQWLQSSEQQKGVRQYIDGYQQHPESAEGWQGTEQMQTEAIVKEQAHETW